MNGSHSSQSLWTNSDALASGNRLLQNIRAFQNIQVSILENSTPQSHEFKSLSSSMVRYDAIIRVSMIGMYGCVRFVRNLGKKHVI